MTRARAADEDDDQGTSAERRDKLKQRIQDLRQRLDEAEKELDDTKDENSDKEASASGRGRTMAQQLHQLRQAQTPASEKLAAEAVAKRAMAAYKSAGGR